MATIHDVAKAAGVSVATVSRVLNQAGNVQPATRQRVLDAIRALHYTPNLLGRNLRQGETRKILVLLNTFSNQFYPRVIKGIEAGAAERGYAVMVGATHGDAAIEDRYLTMLKTRLVDGVIFLSVEQTADVLNAELGGLPAVQACSPRSGFETPQVSIDNVAAGRQAAAYLLQKGHRSIAWLGAKGDADSPAHLRETGFRQALAEASIPIREDWMLQEGFSVNAGIRGAKRLLAMQERPTAVSCCADSCAAGMIKTLSENGVSVPDEISVMGFDNTQLSEVFLPAITTTKQPQFEIGNKAIELLFYRMDGKDCGNPVILLPHEIMERNSVSERKQTVWKK